MTTTKRSLAFVGLLLIMLPVVNRSLAGDRGKISQHRTADTTGKDMDARQAMQFIDAHPEVIVLDVRTPDEYSKGHINKAKNVNLYDAKFVTKMASLDRTKTYVVHCAVGGRSRKAVAVMDSLGFSRVHHLNGGFNSWQKAGQPIVKPN